MIFAGIDIGSTACKAVILVDGEIGGFAVGPATTNPAATAREIFEQAANDAGVSSDDVARVVGTGYGRALVPFADENVSELTCHGRGAAFAHPPTRTVLDIGGQDTKAIRVDADGFLQDYAMNDKCAAGTGRFYESMARSFQISLEEFSELSLSSTDPTPITAQCSVFAESEVVSLVSQKKRPADIAAGVQQSVVRRVVAMARRVGIRPAFAVSGGCAKNAGLRALLEERLGMPVVQTDFDPQLLGALGAALMASRRAR